MDAKTENYRVFNHSLKTLVKMMISSFPQKVEFRVCLVIYKMMKAISKKTPQKYFRDVLLNKHRKVLLEKDDAFFNSYVMDIESFPLSIQVFVKELTNISDIWKGLDSQNKEEIWKQLHTIIAASDKCDESNGCESIT